MNYLLSCIFLLCLSTTFSQSKKEFKELVNVQQQKISSKDSLIKIALNEIDELNKSLSLKSDSIQLISKERDVKNAQNKLLVKRNRSLYRKVEELNNTLNPPKKVIERTSESGFPNPMWGSGSGGPSSPLDGGVFAPQVDNGSERLIVQEPDFSGFTSHSELPIHLKVFMNKTGKVIEVLIDDTKDGAKDFQSTHKVISVIKKTMLFNEKSGANYEVFDYTVVLKP